MSNRQYFQQLQKRLGHRHKDDPSSLSTEALVTLGTALNEEFKKISGGINCSGQQELTIFKLNRLQDETTYKSHREFAMNLASKIRNVGYAIQQGHANREQYAGLRDEQWFFHQQLVDEANLHEGEVKELWLEHADWVAREIHYYDGSFDALNGWLYNLRKEFEKRQPGYKEPALEDMVLKDCMSDEEWAALVEEEMRDEPEPTDEELQIDVLDDYIREQQMRYTTLQISYDRLERIALGKEQASEQQILALREDNRVITHGKYVNNASWKPADKENIRLLTQVAKPEGKSFPIHFVRSHSHFTRNLCLRYGINLTNRQRAIFACTRLAWANNYWGFIEGFEDKGEVIVSLWVNSQNKGDAEVPDFESDNAYDYFFDYQKVDAKTTLIAKQHGDKYLELEIKYAPLSADFSSYTPEQLLEKHKLIMAELHES